MRLTHIKLAGFKTFVDPTTIATPGQLVGIVGPNGCGKSNVIDAVRWVLGESKASALRGDSMQDVIFNGAGERKPVSRASVELQFDNSDARIGGQWGQYTELSLKRVLTREGDSAYYINNIPVRRRDIYDVFLGTGLGPRAYAIIEQGMISRVVEAKPEELRVFLEEAAGVSKYKERRKETESRLKDTRENLARIEDIRAELANQLTHLDAQAKVAAEFHELEAKLKHTQHLLWFSKQQDAARTRERCQSEALQLAVQLEAAQAEVRSIETKLVQMREQHNVANDDLYARQGEYHTVQTEVARLEEQRKSAYASESRLKQQAEQIHAQIEGLATQARQLSEDQQQQEQALEEALSARETAAEEEQMAQDALPELENQVRDATQHLLAAQQELAQLEQAVRVGEAQRNSTQRTIDQLRARREKLESELTAMTRGPGVVSVADVEEQLQQENEALQQHEAALDELQQTIDEQTQQQQDANQQWQDAAKALNAQTARQQALASLQSKVERTDVQEWVSANGLDDCAYLWQKLDIEAGWENALEATLKDRFNALEFDDASRVAEWLRNGGDALPRLTLFTSRRDNPHAQAQPPATALYHKLRIKDSHLNALLADLLYGVHCAETSDEALAKRGDLAPGAAFVTRDGHIISAQSVSFFAPDAEFHGVLSRQRELSELNENIAQAEATADTARQVLDAAEAALRDAQQQMHNQRQAIASQQKRCHNLEVELVQLRKEAEAMQLRQRQLQSECDDIRQQEASENEQLAIVNGEIAEAQLKLHDEMSGRESLRHTRNEAEVALTRGRERLRQAENALQEARFSERSLRDRLADIARQRDSLAQQKASQELFLSDLSTQKQEVDWAQIEASLQEQLAKRAQAEEALTLARETLEALTNALRETEASLHDTEQNIEPARNRIQDMRLKEQAAQLQEQQFTDQLTEAGADIETLPEALKAWGRGSLANEIDRVQKAITALGAVNLAALEELAAASERKSYLDSQAADLNEAMATLENAIRQIDKESRDLLRSTFDAVNENFSKLFPALFGGGQARLVLTGEEILDSGVQLVAQPPGKRNTTIHLLSGGEKALTATALVFALFQLNPAPFCLLDEVDAPLDESNTVRFCNLVRHMSDKTQFLFITHNKVVMEMATQLLGITMPELGVSRTVAVDIAEAIGMATQ